MANSDLPQDILIDIFSRLPARSIGKFRCLSKTWRNLLSTPHFIKSHLAREKTRKEYLILIHSSSSSIHTVETIKDDDTVSKKLDLPGDWSDVMGSCHGLVLLINYDDEILLANPITLQQVKIPNSPLALKSERDSSYGFGHDSVGDDYKVVAFYFDENYIDTFVRVYSVKRGVWKRLGVFPYRLAYFNVRAAFVNGAFHWLADRLTEFDCQVIAAFDLGNEVFFEIPVPSGVVGVVNVENHLVFNYHVVLGGCLCVVDIVSNSGGIDLWVMKEYGVAESWTKFSIHGNVYGNHFGDFSRPLCFIGDEDEEEVVLIVTGVGLVVYNMKEGMLRDLVVDGDLDLFVDGGTFVESLVSPALCGH